MKEPSREVWLSLAAGGLTSFFLVPPFLSDQPFADRLIEAAPVMVAALTLVVLLRQTKIMQDQHEFSERLRRTALVKELIDKVTEIDADTGTLLSHLALIKNAVRSAGVQRYFEARDMLINDRALRVIRSSGNPEVSRRLQDAMEVLTRNSVAGGSDLPVLEALSTAILDNGLEAKAGWEGAYEGLLGVPTPRTHRDRWDERQRKR